MGLLTLTVPSALYMATTTTPNPLDHKLSEDGDDHFYAI